MEISIYHAHEFNKTIKKHGNDLYTACPSKALGATAPSTWEVFVYNRYFQLVKKFMFFILIFWQLLLQME